MSMASKNGRERESGGESSHSPACLEEPVTSLNQKVDEDELDVNDLELLCQLENHHQCMKNRFKCNGKRKDKLKKKKKRKVTEVDMDDVSQVFQDNENTSTLKNCSHKSSLLRKKHKKRKMHSDFKQSSPLVETCDVQYPVASGVTLLSLAKIKKHKKQKHNAHLKIQATANESAPRKLTLGNNSKSNVEGFCEYFSLKPTQDDTIKRERLCNVDKADDPNIKKTSKSVVCETLFVNENKPSAQAADVDFVRPSAKSGINSSIVNGVDEKSPKQDDMCSTSDHSQDLFITQKSFQPIQTSSGTSYDSPPLGQEPLTGSLGSLQKYSHTDIVQMFSQVSTFRVNGANHSNISQCNVTSVIKNSITVMEKDTQTDDDFSYLSLMPSLNKPKIVEFCAEKPLDLCLPTRIRAPLQLEYVEENDDVTIIGVKPAATALVPKVEDRKISLSQLRKCEEGKFVQTVLNSSYFFKGKGEYGDKVHMTPILKQKSEPKKRVRKSVCFRIKKENSTVRRRE